MFSQDFTCPDLLDFTLISLSHTGLSPTMAKLSRIFCWTKISLRAFPISLAATAGISIDFFSSRYLDVSVPQVCLLYLCIQYKIIYLCILGFPIRKSSDQNLFTNFPRLIAGYHVLHRLMLPRHPPCALPLLDHITLKRLFNILRVLNKILTTF